MKWDRSLLITLVYSLFTILYTLYIIAHPGHFNMHKGPHWAYYLKFILIGNYLFFILQGVLLRSKNWGILLLLPLGILAAAILTGFLMVGLIRLGGGTLLNGDSEDMVMGSFIVLILSFFALRLIRSRKK
jgi:hypothetical protein